MIHQDSLLLAMGKSVKLHTAEKPFDEFPNSISNEINSHSKKAEDKYMK